LVSSQADQPFWGSELQINQIKIMYTTANTLLSAVTATTTSAGIAVGDRVKMSIQFIGTSLTVGIKTATFLVTVSDDGTNYITYNRLTDNLTNTNSQNDTRVGSCALTSNTSKIYFFPEGDHFEYLKATVNLPNGGTATAILHSVI